MNFAQLEYPLFLAFVVVAIGLTRPLIARKAIALLASLYFYAYWDYRFLALLLFSTAWDYGIGLALDQCTGSSIRRLLLGLSIAGNLGLLGFFKYYNFFIESAELWLTSLGLHAGSVSIILPIGISFYTFQTLSYSIDVYRRRLPACRDVLDFALYVTFFPQLVAGPIVRASEFLPQLRSGPVVKRSNLYPGAALIFRGFIKKVLIADQLGFMVDNVFATPAVFQSATVALGLLAYAGQIYGDFSGYSDIAIGSARLMGMSLPVNFRHPYLATSITDFWRRWHITLSTWLRDYLYIPLGGNRRGPIRTYVNLMITMLLGGLWHGAAWTFVLWGAWHGAALAAERWLMRKPSAGDQTVLRLPHQSNARSVLGWMLTMAVVLLGWLVFRCRDLEHVKTFISAVMNGSTGVLWLPPFPLIALLLLVAEHLLWLTRWRYVLALPPHRALTPWLVGFGLAALALFGTGNSQPFVYFQF